ncbi:uncharacterized protein [Phyllobates terribilis]|uniref:uncharacterized protein n=1 Tax=Phyllobates terribilis TaxID=111132 RepID=UPI003CCB6472
MSVYLLLLLVVLLPQAAFSASYDIETLGGRGDGKTDSSTALEKAWELACNSTSNSIIRIPRGRFLIARPLVFSGYHCALKKKDGAGIRFRIQGVLLAPADYSVFRDSDTWFSFEGVTGVTVSGGALDAQGRTLWACKASKGRCPLGVTTMAFTNSKEIRISGVTSLNSQLYHIVINGCKDVMLEGLQIFAAGDSPNTDGIHVQLSDTITIVDSKIGTGDDCVSVGPGTTNLSIDRVICGPGHGISIGSLAKVEAEPGVQGVTVKNTVFYGTQNGVRIKSWGRPSSAFVKDVLFQHLTMIDVQNPIIIDQNYCPSNIGCPGHESGVKISDVMYQDIHGTSATEVAVKLDCSPKSKCTGIKMKDVKLTYMNHQDALSSCVNAVVSLSGVNHPTACL